MELNIIVVLLIFAAVLSTAAIFNAIAARGEVRKLTINLDKALARLSRLEKQTDAADTHGTIKPEENSPPVDAVQPSAVATAAIGQAMKEARASTTSEPAVRSIAPPPLPSQESFAASKDSDLASRELSRSLVPEKFEAAPPAIPTEPFSLEKFMGVKMFAWLGGIAMFFGVILFVKYAFEKNLIPPPMRIILGYLTGGLLLGGGLFLNNSPRYKVLAQSLCATAVLILYGVTFAAHSIYKFPAFGTIPTFVIMAGITFGAFFMAVRLNALVVAGLGMVGGFLTPILLSTGQDPVWGLFGYIALLDIGLLAVSRHSNWRYLTSFAAAGTAMMMAGWYLRFFDSGGYAFGMATLVPMGLILGFILLFLCGGWIFRKKPYLHAVGSTIALASVATLMAFNMHYDPSVGQREILLHGFLFIVHLAVMVAVVKQPRFQAAQILAAGAIFVQLGCWTVAYLNSSNLLVALSLYLVFGVLHGIGPLLLARRYPSQKQEVVTQASPWIGPVVLAIMGIALAVSSPLASGIWFGVFMVVLMVISVAVMTRSILPVLVSLGLTFCLALLWISRAPVMDHSVTQLLAIATAFPLTFVSAGLWLASRRIIPNDSGKNLDAMIARALPALSAGMPFVLLMVALWKLPLPNPTPVFAVALLMAFVLGVLAIIGKQGSLVLIALAGVLIVETTWHLSRNLPVAHDLALGWYAVFYAAFLLFPLLLKRKCETLGPVWIASALSGVGQFILVYNIFDRFHPNEVMGLIPAAFAVPSLVAVAYLVKTFPVMDARQRSRLAWFTGVALLFITLIFPIQLERQWLTVSWAMEGALLIWLFHRVPHPGLQATGLALLGIAFWRLTPLNEAIFSRYPRAGMPILNWYLYSYGIVAASLIAAAIGFRDPRKLWLNLYPKAVLYTAGGLLLFGLLNIEIADYFTPRGNPVISFAFGGNFARDMTYSIGWGLFSLGLLAIGFITRSRHARYAAVVILIFTLLKVFLHDLAAIENIFRIGAFLGVAVIAFVASFLYQRFFDRPNA